MIQYYLEQEARDVLNGEVELDESYFGGQRKGKRGRGAAGKVAVFGLLKQGGKKWQVFNTLMKFLKCSPTNKIGKKAITMNKEYIVVMQK